jgi:predicted PhzF superfamily epimerase YddE/YHI9
MQEREINFTESTFITKLSPEVIQRNQIFTPEHEMVYRTANVELLGF